MLMDLINTKTIVEQEARSTVSAASRAFYEDIIEITSRLRSYEAYLMHLRTCLVAVGCDLCAPTTPFGIDRSLETLRHEARAHGEDQYQVLQPWFDRLEQAAYVGHKLAVCAHEISSMTQKFHAMVETIEDDRATVVNMTTADRSGRDQLRTAYEQCEQISADTQETVTAFRSIGARHHRAAYESVQNLAADALGSTPNRMHANVVYMLVSSAVANRHRRLEIELDRYAGWARDAAAKRRARIAEILLETVSL